MTWHLGKNVNADKFTIHVYHANVQCKCAMQKYNASAHANTVLDTALAEVNSKSKTVRDTPAAPQSSDLTRSVTESRSAFDMV